MRRERDAEAWKTLLELSKRVVENIHATAQNATDWGEAMPLMIELNAAIEANDTILAYAALLGLEQTALYRRGPGQEV